MDLGLVLESEDLTGFEVPSAQEIKQKKYFICFIGLTDLTTDLQFLCKYPPLYIKMVNLELLVLFQPENKNIGQIWAIFW